MIYRFLKNMKMSKVKQILLLAEWVPFLPLALGMVLLLCLYRTELGGLAVVLGLALCILSTVLRMGTRGTRTMELTMIRDRLLALQTDRTYFASEAEPRSRMEWASTLIDAGAALRLSEADRVSFSEDAPIYFGTGTALAMSTDRVERFVFVYSVSTLGVERYEAILADAKDRMRDYPLPISEEQHARAMENMRLGYGSAIAVVVLADEISEDVLPAAKAFPEFRYGVIATAFVDVTENRVYANGEKRTSPDLTCEYDAQKLIVKLLFPKSGKFPTEGGTRTAAYEELYAKLDTQTCGEYFEESKKSTEEMKAEEQQILSELTDGGFALSKGVLYHKVGERVMSLLFFANDESEEPIGESPAPMGREVSYTMLFMSWEKPNRLMKKREKEQYLPELIDYMESLGYTIKADTEIEK